MFSYKIIRILFSVGFVLFAGVATDAFLLNSAKETDHYDHIYSRKRSSRYGGGEIGYVVTESGKKLSLPDDWNYYFEYGQPLTVHTSILFKQPLYFEVFQKGNNTNIPVNSLNSSLAMKIFVMLTAICYLTTIISFLKKKYPNDMVGMAAMLFGFFSCLLFFW